MITTTIVTLFVVSQMAHCLQLM